MEDTIEKEVKMYSEKLQRKERADELYKYCNRHLKETHFGTDVYADLYRIFTMIVLLLINKYSTH